MGKRVLRQTRQAKADLRVAARYIAESNPGAAGRLLEFAEVEYELLSQMPLIGRVYGFTAPTVRSLRVWHIRGFRAYLIFYRPLENGVEILRVMHGARDIDEKLFTKGE